MVKYFLTYKGIEGDVYLFEIFETGYDGEPIEIHGYVNHNYASRKDLVQPTIASSLDISLEADEDLTLQDLYTEEESKFKVQLKRNDQTIFYGILKPDGIWEDFVSERWEISMDAMDGLSILKDLSFVKDPNEFGISEFYTGKITQFEALKQCLHRIGYDLPINISTDLPVYDGFTGTDTILKSVKMNADRFYQEKQTNQIMDCEAVLKSVLEIYSATIVQMNGEWWVFRPIDVKNEMNFYRYDGEVKTDIVWNAELNIGSHIDQFEIFHANANQKKSINPSAQAFRVNYKYGTVRSIYRNEYLELESLTGDAWTVQSIGGKVTIQPDGNGIEIKSFIDETEDVLLIQSNDVIPIEQNDIIDANISMAFNTYKNEWLEEPGKFITSNQDLVYAFSTPNYNFNGSSWVLKSAEPDAKFWVYYENPVGNVSQKITLPPMPESGSLSFAIYLRKLEAGIALDNWEPRPGGNTNMYIIYTLDKIEFTPSAGNYKGEFHTAQRLTRISSVTKADKTVSVGDSISDIYLGTLYKANGDPTELWPTKPLLRLMVEDALRIAPRPMYFFEGDVFGYFPYLSHVLINNVAGRYQVAKYSFDTKKNVNRCNFKEFDNVVLVQGTDYRYEFDYDYGNETRVTIRS